MTQFRADLPIATVGAALPCEALVQLPDGKSYESEEEFGPTAELVLEDEELIGLPDKADKSAVVAAAAGGSRRRGLACRNDTVRVPGFQEQSYFTSEYLKN